MNRAGAGTQAVIRRGTEPLAWVARLALAMALAACTRPGRWFGPPVVTAAATLGPAATVASLPSPTAAATTATPTVELVREPISADSVDQLVELQDFVGHTDGVTDLAFVPDGTLLASSSRDGSIRLWRAATGTTANVLEGHTDIVWSLAISPDGTRLVSASDDRTLRIWSLPQGSPLDRIRSGSFGRGLQVVFSPDGLWFAAGDQFCLVQVRSARTGVLLRSLIQPVCDAYGGNVVDGWGLAFTPDSQEILTAEAQGGRGTVQRWSLDRYLPPERVQGTSGGVRAMALSPDGTQLALAFVGSAAIWIVDSHDGSRIHSLEGHTYGVNDLAFSPDGRLLASASADRTVGLWQVGSGVLLRQLVGHADRVTAVGFSADGSRLASGAGDGTILLWGVEP
jgi:WD40 repeat protein